MNEIQVVETPLEEGVSHKEVRAALAKSFPAFRLAALIEDKEEGVWRAKLVKQAEFPPGAEDDDSESEAPDDEAPAPKKKPKPKFEDADEAEDAEDGGDDEDAEGEGDEAPEGLHHPEEHGDPRAKAEHLLSQLEHLLPQLEHLLKGGLGGGMDDAGPHMEPTSPHLAPPTPPAGGPPAGGPPQGMPGAEPPRPSIPGGRPPGAAPRMRPGQIPTFTKRRTQLLEREANVTIKEAREELESEFPEYAVTEIKKAKNKFLAKLELR